jgi:hypothetical protein
MVLDDCAYQEGFRMVKNTKRLVCEVVGGRVIFVRVEHQNRL